MTRVMGVQDIRQLIEKVGIKNFFLKLVDQIRSDYQRFDEFDKHPRFATHLVDGVIELMPISDQQFYSFKYVNGHPNNPKSNLQSVVGIGQLSSIENGYPLLVSEMTVLTAMRTAATSALASQYLASKKDDSFGIIGTGAQGEFQVLAHQFLLGTREVHYFDTDPKAMEKFKENLKPHHVRLSPCKDARSVVENSSIITTATAQRGHHKIIEKEWLRKGQHINKIGGDCPGKTELDPEILSNAKIVVEFLEQTKIEGEIQQGNARVYATLEELVSKKKPGRESEEEITLFDSVGFAIEDYSILRLVHELSQGYRIGQEIDLIPKLSNPKDLFRVLR